jgi:hypothetical protein
MMDERLQMIDVDAIEDGYEHGVVLPFLAPKKEAEKDEDSMLLDNILYELRLMLTDIEDGLDIDNEDEHFNRLASVAEYLFAKLVLIRWGEFSSSTKPLDHMVLIQNALTETDEVFDEFEVELTEMHEFVNLMIET